MDKGSSPLDNRNALMINDTDLPVKIIIYRSWDSPCRVKNTVVSIFFCAHIYRQQNLRVQKAYLETSYLETYVSTRKAIAKPLRSHRSNCTRDEN